MQSSTVLCIFLAATFPQFLIALSPAKPFLPLNPDLSIPSSWIPPTSIWSQLKFPLLPEKVLLENRINSGGIPTVPEPFDASKVNISIAENGYVIGQKFCQCGRSPWRSRYGYSEDDPFRNDVPWTATLVLKKFQNVFCGGALLNDRTVITAAHCLLGMKPKDLSVHIAEDDLLPSSSTIYETHKFSVAEIRLHPGYSRQTLEHDMALIILSQPIDFFEIPISPVCLPVQNDEYAKYKGTVTEWVSVLDSRGKNSSDNLQKTTLDLISTAECNTLEEYQGLVSENHICTKSCQGDHGGQLLVEKKDRQLLVGIGSWRLNCRGSETPSVFTRVAKYAAWILKNTKQAEWCVE